MKAQTLIYEIIRIEQKYALVVEMEGNQEEKLIPKYKLPLEIKIGAKITVNALGMYQLTEER